MVQTPKVASQKVVTFAAGRDMIVVAEPRRIPLVCACGHCHLPYAYVVLALQGSYIEIVSTHHGEAHTNIIPLLSSGALAITGKEVQCTPLDHGT